MRSIGEATRNFSTRVRSLHTAPRNVCEYATHLPAQLITPRKPPFTRQMTKQPISSISQFAGDSAAYSKRLIELSTSLTQNQPDENVSLLQLDRMRQLVVCIHEHPNVAEDAWKTGLVPWLQEVKRLSRHEELVQQANIALALLGHVPDCKGKGLRILSIDGGGVRGLIPVLLLKHIEQECGQRIHKLFDYVCGTSTGALLAAMLFMRQMEIDEAEQNYKDLSGRIFSRNNLLGLGQLFLNQSFYDSSLLQRLLRDVPLSDLPMFESSGYTGIPRMSFVSTLANHPVIEPLLFTNYRHHPSDTSNYRSITNVKIWEAIIASTAAPGYFEEVNLGPYVLQDGGLLANNPCAIALHEARLLWGRNTPIQCVISLGTGLFGKRWMKDRDGPYPNTSKSTSLREKLTKVVASATDTEAVHVILKDLLPPSTYFRFNPDLCQDITLDDASPERIQMLEENAQRYIQSHTKELQDAAHCLLEPITVQLQASNWFKTQINILAGRLPKWITKFD